MIGVFFRDFGIFFLQHIKISGGMLPHPPVYLLQAIAQCPILLLAGKGQDTEYKRTGKALGKGVGIGHVGNRQIGNPGVVFHIRTEIQNNRIIQGYEKFS